MRERGSEPLLEQVFVRGRVDEVRLGIAEVWRGKVDGNKKRKRRR